MTSDEARKHADVDVNSYLIEKEASDNNGDTSTSLNLNPQIEYSIIFGQREATAVLSIVRLDPKCDGTNKY